MWKDSIVEEIRRIRLNIEAKCDNDFDKIFAQAIAVQEKLAKNTQYLRDHDAEPEENQKTI